jgi:hypothetical protein
MKKNLAIYITLTILAAIILGGVLFYLKLKKERKMAAEQKIEEMRAELARKDPMRKEIYSTSTPYFDAKIEYPKDFEKIKDKMFGTYDAFLAETNILNVKSKADAEAIGMFNGGKYQFILEYKVATSSMTTSFITQNYFYTGGAHGGVSKIVYNLDKDGKYLPPDYFLPTSALKVVSDYAYKDLKNQIETRSEMKMEDDSMLKDGSAPRRDNYLVVWPDGDNTLVVYFGQYQVAPYAYGEFEVRVPKSLIK